MHHNVIIVDGETTVAGSFNFSDGADKQNDENVVIIKNRDVASRFEEEFQRVYGAAAGK
jgi:phosphatidylserine/phosphatidylglycerophosphate/cardiolipin synthase-like enzyme